MMFPRAATAENARQAIKTAVAGLVSMYVARLFHLPEGYWAAISALIVMQSNVGATLSASRTRLAGTAVGAVVGGAFVALWGDSIPGFALAVALAFFLCFVLRLPDSQRLATVTVAIIMLIGRPVSPWTVALHRFIEVSLGILIALVISLTLWPNRARRSLREGLAAALVKLGALYQAVTDARGSGALDALNTQVSDIFRKNADLLQNALQESFGPLRERDSLVSLAAHVDRLRRAVETLEFAVRDSAPGTYAHRFDAELEQLHSTIAADFGWIANSVRNGSSEPLWPDSTAAITALDDKATAARESGATASHPLDEILRFYSLLLSSRNLVQELELARGLVTSRFVSK